MRSPRLKVSGASAVYHCLSRIVGGQHLLDDPAKEQFRTFMWAVVQFCGVELLTFTIMRNHFHLLIRVLAPQEISDEEVQNRVRNYFGPRSGYTLAVDQDMKNTGKISAALRKRLLRRMGDLSICLKELKQRFTRWYNGVHDRYGTLWAERFKSVLVEEKRFALELMAAYIDLNCVRAGLVDDPKDYRFCGYAESMAQPGLARQGLASLLQGKDWSDQASYYRRYLFLAAANSGHSDKLVLDREIILKKLENEGQLPMNELLRLKIRYFTDGAVLGSQNFVDEVFAKFQQHFGKQRQSGARPMRGANWQGLMVLRQLRLRVFE